MKTFKDLIDTTSVIWINNEVNDAIKQMGDDLENLNISNMIPGMSINKNEVQMQFTSTKNQLSALKTFADVVGYAKLNKGGLNSMLKDADAQANLANMFASGETPNVSKLIAKVQLGAIFESIIKNADMVRDLMDKIGRETPISEVKFDDLNYLLNKSVKPEIDDLVKLLDTTNNILKEVEPEIKDLAMYQDNWQKKKTDKDVIDIYVVKQRNAFLNNPAKMAELTHGAPMNSQFVTDGQKIIDVMNNLDTKLDFGYLLVTEFNKVKNS